VVQNAYKPKGTATLFFMLDSDLVLKLR